jgi:integrase
MRRMRLATEEAPPPETTVTVDEAAEHLMRDLEAIGRRPSTLATYRSLYRTHLQWSVGEVALERITRRDIEELDRVMRRKELAPKTRLNALKLLSEIFAFAKRQGWCRRNPCEQVRFPQVERTSDIRFLTEAELVALLGAVDIDKEPLGHTDWAMFLTAALTGLRQSELLGLEWRDVDFESERVRVQRSNVRGHWVGQNRAIARARCRWRRRSRPPFAGTWIGLHAEIAKISSSGIPAPAKSSAPRRSIADSRRRCERLTCATSASRTCATPLGRGSRQTACRLEIFRSGWDTRTSGRRRSTPPTNLGSTRLRLSTRHSPKFGWTSEPQAS